MWIYRNKPVQRLADVPEGAIGFVYMIVNTETTEHYFGKKNIFANRTLPPLKGERRKRKVTKESDWLKYQSSNSTVKSWISPHKEIIEYCYTKKELTYREMQAIVCMQGLEDEKCLNDNVLGKFFRADLKR